MRRFLFLAVVLLVAGATAWLLLRDRGTSPAAALEGERDLTPRPNAPVLAGRADPPSAPSGPGAPEAQTTDTPWETRRGFDLADDEPVKARGRVLFRDGRPAPGAYVWRTFVFRPLLRSEAELGHHDFFVAAARTDEDGRYRFTERQLPVPLRADAFLARRGEEVALLLESGGGDGVLDLPDLVLGPAVLVEAEVADTRGDVVATATGQLAVHFGALAIPALLLGDVSDAQGRLRFLPVPDRPDLALGLRVTHAQYPEWSERLDVDALRRGEPLRVELPAGRTVRGRLVAPEGTAPDLLHLRVAGYDPEWGRLRLLDGVQAAPDASGAFEVQGVPPERSSLLVYTSPDGPRRVPDLYGTIPYVFEIPAGRHGEVRDLGPVYLESAGAIRGVVLDAEGVPVVGAHVRVSLPIDGIQAARDAAADAAGGFAFAELPAAAYDLRVTHTSQDFGRREVRLDAVHPSGDSLTLVLRGGATLVLRFHPAGRPEEEPRLPGFTCRVESPPEHAGKTTVTRAGRSTGNRRAAGQALARIRLEPGTYVVTLSAAG